MRYIRDEIYMRYINNETIDFSKTFKVLDHDILLKTIVSKKLENSLWNCSKIFLEGIDPLVKIKNCIGEPKPIFKVIPKGLVH